MNRPPLPSETDLLLRAYRGGFFPMADPGTGEISWYSPDPRAIIPLDAFHIPRSLRRLIRAREFEVRIDTAFGDVIRACADRDESWISATIISWYTALHDLGAAHSVEAWREKELAGGLYGVAIGGAFFGESMFSRIPGASKVALAALVERLGQRGFVLLDTQFLNPHLLQFGAVEIPRGEYLERVAKAITLRTIFGEESAPGHRV